MEKKSLVTKRLPNKGGFLFADVFTKRKEFLSISLYALSLVIFNQFLNSSYRNKNCT